MAQKEQDLTDRYVEDIHYHYGHFFQLDAYNDALRRLTDNT